ncbi:MAG: acyl-CoA thioesterase [Spirochaetaceae bacterium]|jgi:acyl-CoA thioester hydrolase|nr:acyl-CoA thioesterase [Spirochaetaceae bacterium]
MVCESTVVVRTYECDHYGHVNNAHYLHYLEYARYEFLKSVGFDYPGAIKAGYGVYVARIEIDYKKSAVVDDVLTIRSWPLKKGAVSGIIAQEIKRGAEVIVEAQVTWAFVGPSGQPTRIPDPWNVPGLTPEEV